ncbi:MAG: multiheme c-type cytochrome, partial [Myxococcota bacterium]
MVFASRSAVLIAVATLAACNRDSGPTDDTLISGVSDRLLDPETCQECHPDHYREWLSSMHAYAAEDPIFIAMNRRGQRETNGALGDFCIKCHAPLAVELGLTTDGLNLDEVPKHLQGVTCYFCHTVASVEDTHNNPLTLTRSATMLGAIRDPVDNDVHGSDYSPFVDSLTQESGDMCGACHDIVNANGVHLERTYAEWLDSFMADTDPLSGAPAPYALRCASCHMGPAQMGPIADIEGVRADRFKHSHLMAGVDVALTPWPDAAQAPALEAEQLEKIEFQRKSALCATICVNPDPADDTSNLVDVWLHNEFTAHSWPSGATQDRRAWLELQVFSGADPVLQSGVLPPGQALTELEVADPLLWQFRDRIFDGAGSEVHMFWEAESNVSELLPASAILSAEGDASTWRSRRFRVEGSAVDRVTTTLHLRPVGLDVIDSLIESGDLDASFRDTMPTFEVAPTVLEWTPAVAIEYEGYGPCVNSSDSCGAVIVGAASPG